MARIEDFEQYGASGYYYRRPYDRRSSPYVLATCEGCGDPCLVRVGAPVGKFCSVGCVHRGERAAGAAAWRGDDVGYRAAHIRVAKVRGRADHCIWGHQSNYYEWANLTGNLADTDDYAPMCRRCHSRFDAAIRMMTVSDGRWRPAKREKTSCPPSST